MYSYAACRCSSIVGSGADTGAASGVSTASGVEVHAVSVVAKAIAATTGRTPPPQTPISCPISRLIATKPTDPQTLRAPYWKPQRLTPLTAIESTTGT